ncbi:SAM domain-containing protein SAMSN-1 [Oryzias melastigma]|uniref:SAM domain-containing protein SAMSN-1 n=1 Tax=Oryzias melastigma TaxID=30732 RepID=A0A834C5T8_ORYME|nr:SAM domain-containing protein SAMSN-1 [Oryzias melastigma]
MNAAAPYRQVQPLAVCQPLFLLHLTLRDAQETLSANMNLFCFSLEGSMDSLYEAVQSSGDGPPPPIPSRSSSRSCSRSCSPAVLLEDNTKWRGSGRCASTDQPHTTNSNKKKRRTHISKSASDNETLDNPVCNTAVWQPAKSQEDLAHVTNKHNEVHSPSGTLSPPLGPQFLDVPYPSRPDKRLYLGKSSTLPSQENTTPGRYADMVSLPGGATPTHHQRWSNPSDSSPAWSTIQHTCRRPLTEYRAYSHEFSTLQSKEWKGSQQAAIIQDGSLKRDREPQLPPKVPRSATQVDLSEPNRSTSFGRFEGLRHHSSHAKPEDNGTSVLREDCESPDPHKSTGLGKKMKEISLTMRRKMGKKHAKSFSEETGDDTDKDPEAEHEAGQTGEKNSAKTSISLESLYSGQSSSSGVTSESNGSGQRDSLKLEEDGSYHGQFCGRARVHTDFVPSPYDTDSLKLKVGDIINIISKPPMGIWTGMLNNKVGNFKFIYVDVLEEKEEEEEAPKIRPQKLCRRPRPTTLLELLERLNLEEYASALLLNGYQTVEDLLHLQEKHLIELNVKDAEHRHKLLAAAEYHYTAGDDVRDTEENRSSNSLQEEDSDCPRDSGCFIPSECSETKDDAEQVPDAPGS